MKLKSKTILVTGGNSGLGFEISELLVSKKANVIMLSKDKKKLENAKKELNSKNVSTIACDIRDNNQVETSLEKVKDLDILINCAGVINYQPLEKVDSQNIKNIIDTNLLGTIYVTRQLLPIFKKKNSGTIVNISSTSGLLTGGHPNECVYIASKFGVTGFTHALKKELEDEKANIRLLGFYPGGMNTPLFKKAGLVKDTDSFMDPKEIAEIIIFMLERPDSIKMDHVVVNRNKNLD